MRFDRASNPTAYNVTSARPGTLLAAGLALVLAAPAAWAQQMPDLPTIRKTDLATIDRNNVESWINQQVQALLKMTPDQGAALKAQGQQFYAAVSENVKAADASARFRDGVAAILTDAVLNAYPKAPKTRHPLAAVYVFMVLNQVAQPTPKTVDAFTLALSEPTPGGRMMGISGLLTLRAQLTPQQWTALLPVVQKLAADETNEVVLARAYRFLALPANNPPVDSVPAVLAILEARLGRIEQQNGRPLAADAEAIEWLGGRLAAMTNTQQRDRAIRIMARMLTNAVYIYANKPLPEHQQGLEKVVRVGEDQLKKAVARLAPSAKPGDITNAMLTNVTAQTDSMLLELNKWIGTAQQPGALNQAPFNYEVGLKITRPSAATKPAVAAAPK